MVDVVALRPAGDGRIDSVKQRIDNNFQQAVKPNVLPQQPAADETRESGAAKEGMWFILLLFNLDFHYTLLKCKCGLSSSFKNLQDFLKNNKNLQVSGRIFSDY